MPSVILPPPELHQTRLSPAALKRRLKEEDINKNIIVAEEEEEEEESSEQQKQQKMAPNRNEKDQIETTSTTASAIASSTSSSVPYRREIVWRNVLIMAALHALALYAVLFALPVVSAGTFYFAFLLAFLTSLGVQGGAHRLFAHRAYKANQGVRLFLSLCHVLALQNDLYEWCRDHRAHHKFSDTDADPHNSTRGFFFSHVGWLLVKKHPEVLRRGRTLDMSDLEADPIVMWQRRFYLPMVTLLWGLLPTYIPVYLWGESPWNAFLVCVVLRYVYTLNVTWCVNSWSHLYGYRPYDAKIAPVEATIRHVLNGEGFHNFHHTFPWDYSASELGPYDVFNPVTAVIDLFHYMGWAWDLKKASPALVGRRVAAGGDEQLLAACYHTKERTAAREWVGGLATFFGPMVVLRYGLIAAGWLLF